MKKHTQHRKLYCGLFLGLLIFNFTFRSYADTAVDDKNSTASTFITVTAPSSNSFYLKEAPENFDFGSVPIDILTTTLRKTASIPPLQVVNITGNGQNFKLQAQIGDFVGVGDTNSGIVLPVESFTINVEDSLSGVLQGTGDSGVDIYKQEGVLLEGDSSATGLNTSGDISAQIDIDATRIRNFDSFQGTINYSLVNGL